jgi:hypothetical protein
MSVIFGGQKVSGSYGPFLCEGTPTDGSSGTQAGVAAVGALLLDVTNAVLYRNTGSQSSPTWSRIGTNQVMSKEFNIDNGNGVTDDDLMGNFRNGAVPIAAWVVYSEASDSGDASGASIQLGSSKGGSDIVAATNLENGKAIGSVTALTLGSGVDDVGAYGSIWARHTGVAATQVGKYYVIVEYKA